jgi:hypothetical protein
MQPLYQTVGQLEHRYTALLTEINRYAPGQYPTMLCLDVLHLIHDTKRWIAPDRHEQNILDTARTLAEGGDPKRAMFKVHEVINGRVRL